MKKIIAIAIAAAGIAAFADQTTDETARIVRAIESVTGWTADELAGGLEMLNHIWREDMKTPQGRKKWNGAVVSTVIDTNALTRTTVHTNGYVHVERFASVNAIPIEQRLSAAELRARREAAAKAAAEKREQERLARIDLLENRLDDEIAALMKARRWPYELARLYLLNELNELKASGR